MADASASDIAFWEKGLSKMDRWLRSMCWIESTWTDHTRRCSELDKFHRLYYGNTAMFYGDGQSYHGLPSMGAAKQAVDTLCNVIISEDTRAKAVPVNGEWSDRRKCTEIEKFCDGTLDNSSFYSKLRPRCVMDAGIYGDGFIQLLKKKSGIWLERVYAGDIIVDEASSALADPVVLGRVRNISAHSLARMYPKNKEAIYRSVSTRPEFMQQAADMTSWQDVSRYMTYVYDIWFCTGEQDDIGWFIRVLPDGGNMEESAVLESEEYRLTSFPIKQLQLNPARANFFGQSVAGFCAFEQEETDKLSKRFSDNAHLCSNAYVFAEENTVDPKAFTNKPGTIIMYKAGTAKPTIQTPPSIASDAYGWNQFLLQHALQKNGLSQLSAFGKKPAEVEAAVAMQELQDIESIRLASAIKADANWVVDICEGIIEMAADMYKQDGISVKSKYVTSSYAETVDWGEINLDRDRFVINVMPSSLLPRTPGAKLGRVGFMMNNGLIEKDEALSLLGHSDVDSTYALSSSTKDYVDRAAEEILHGEGFIEPNEYLALDFAMKRMGSIRNRAVVDGAPPDRIKLIERWIDECVAIKQALIAQEQAQAAAMAPPPGMEQGAPPPEAAPPEIGPPPEAMVPGEIPPPAEGA